MDVAEVTETDIRTKALIVIEYLVSQPKPNYKEIYKAAHVGSGCDNPHVEWRKWLDGQYAKVRRHHKVVKE